MSQGPETTFIGAVHRHLPAGLYRLKNHNQFNSGIADVWYDGVRDLWVEYKFLTVPKLNSTLINLCHPTGKVLSPLQQKWLEDRHANKRNVAVIVGCKDGGVIFPGLDWQKTISAAEFRKNLVSRKDVAGWIERQTNG